MIDAARRAQALVAIIAIALAAAACSREPAHDPSSQERAAPGSRVALDLRFTAKWWSEAQMDGLNPNNPPPKTTEVELQRWEYSDPIGVPHPDMIDAVITIENLGADDMSALSIHTEGEWRTGPRQDEAAAAWGERKPLADDSRVAVRSGTRATVRVPIDLKAVMDRLERDSRWPYALRIAVVVTSAGSEVPLARAQKEFLIRPGD